MKTPNQPKKLCYDDEEFERTEKVFIVDTELLITIIQPVEEKLKNKEIVAMNRKYRDVNKKELPSSERLW